MTNHENSREIRQDIDETRRDMGRKIDAIQNQLSPEHLKIKAREVVDDVATSTADSLSEYMRNNMGDIGHSVAHTLKQNPIPTALVGLGLGWLLIESFSSNGESQVRYPLTRYRPAAAYGAADEYDVYRYNRNRNEPTYGSAYASNGGHDHDQGVVDQVKEKVGNAAGAVQQKAEQWMGQAQEQVNNATYEAQRMRDEARLQSHLAAMDARDHINEWQDRGQSYTQHATSDTQRRASRAAHEARSYAADAAHEARNYAEGAAHQVGSYANYASDQAQYYAHRAGEQAYAAGEQVVETIEENPLTFGVISLAVGAAIGLLLPQTRRENEWVGPYRDRVTDAAAATASDAATHLQEAVDEIRPEVEQSAQRVMDELKTTGRTVAEDLKKTGESVKQEAKEVGEHAKTVAEEKTEATKADAKQHAHETVDS
ncbi:MAG TPA: DUF3618 domain-containing protein [Caldilineaceae bacterium]|nr:DUF3618 domain-containing protein [Caldilineaceae bacterium]